MQFIQIADMIVNLSNVVAFDIDGQNIVRIWFTGSPTPLQLAGAVPAAPLIQALRARGIIV